ncbi:methionyl-tRNA formyltransferase [Candidatus Daviesbacteria bacterium]|nr:methionyl-tRNA formyltransferase [Candidatus Daviesbacteria bacterium]
MTIVFFGNTKYSIIGLKIVNATYPISLVVTIPGSPVQTLAQQLNIDVLKTKILDQKVIQKIKGIKTDFFIVEDYGLILPKELLNLPKIAPLNIHHSLLPKYRGPSPAPSAILNGERNSGVSIIRIIEQVDAGPILGQLHYELTPEQTTDSLLTKLNELGGALVISVIKQYLDGLVKPLIQDESRVTFTKRLTKEDGYFDINNPPAPEILDRMIRAYYPWPGVWTRFRQGSSGQAKIVKFLPGGMMQMEGKKAVKFEVFLRGYPGFPIKT